MLEVLTNPNSFFKRKINEDIEWKTPLLIMTVMTCITFISSYIIAITAVESALEGTGSFGSVGKIIMMGVMIISAVIGTVFAWLLYSAVFYIISLLFNGEGDFKRLMEFIAYGFIPNIVGTIISLYFLNKVMSNIDFSATDPNLIKDVMMADPSMRISGIIGILFTLWSANIWLFGVMYARNISLKNSLIAVGIPIIASVLYSISTLFIL
jgi:hypothetical protein